MMAAMAEFLQLLACLWILEGIFVASMENSLVVSNKESKQITSREGCREVLTCTGNAGFGISPVWSKQGSKVTGGELILKNITNNGVVIHSSTLLFEFLRIENQALYHCDLAGEMSSRRSTVPLKVLKGTIGIQGIENIDLSRLRRGSNLIISCSVETCIDDVVVQIFKDDQLLESVTVPERNMLVSFVELKVSEQLVGKYACQAMSEKRNEVQREFFTVTGAPPRE